MSKSPELLRNSGVFEKLRTLGHDIKDYGDVEMQKQERNPTNVLAFNKKVSFQTINTSYLTDSCIDFTLKMESVSKNTIFGLKMTVKSGLEKFILKSLQITEFMILGTFIK